MSLRANKIAKDTKIFRNQIDQSGPETIQKQSDTETSNQLLSNRPGAITYNQFHQLANNSTQVAQLQSIQETANQYMAHQEAPIQPKINNTGLPDNLKLGIENLSGYSMDDVKVHYNSAQPAQLQAQAYAQGTDIHLAPGKEQHLAHEAWHVVQQKQGRVQPTLQMKKGVNVNDDDYLEQEADKMGAKASQSVYQKKHDQSKQPYSFSKASSPVVQRMTDEESSMFNYIKKNDVRKNQAPVEQHEALIEEANRGDQLLNRILNEDPASIGVENLIGHAKDIRAICWALYRKAALKSQAFIGGMIVLKDEGKLANYLMRGTEVKSRDAQKKVKRNPESPGVPYYSRASSHFQERRDTKMGIDFHSFAENVDGKKQVRRDLKLPLQKSTLHFGTLDGGKHTFVKFEYYGFKTVSDTVLHSVEFAKTLISKEVGHRENPKKNMIKAIRKVLREVGVPKNNREEITVGGKSFTIGQSGLHFGRLVINHLIKDEKKKEEALEKLHKTLEGQNETLTDHSHLRQGDEVILDEEELMSPEAKRGRARMNWRKLKLKSALLMRSVPASGSANYTSKDVPLSEKTQSARGAYLANFVGNKERIGESSEYMGDRKNPNSPHHKHLDKFRKNGAYAFITPVIHDKISNSKAKDGFSGWGYDANFVTTKEVVDALIEKHSREGARGIFGFEDDLSIPEAQWVSQSAVDNGDYILYLYKVEPEHLEALNLRVPSGYESGAYGSWWKDDKEYIAGQWRPKGSTEGGQKEAVIDTLPRKDQLDKLGKREDQLTFEKVAKVEKINKLSLSTKKTIIEEERDPKTGKRRGSL